MDILRLLPKDQYDAALNASSPTAGNPFATIADLPAAGVTTFLGLSDAPGTYAGAGDNFVRVNAGATALGFVAASAIGLSTFNNDAGFVTAQAAGAVDQVQFSDGSGGFKLNGYQHVTSSPSFSPTLTNSKSLGTNSLRWATVNAYRTDVLIGDANGYNFSGSGVSAQMTSKTGTGDGITFWGNSGGSGRRMNVGASRGVIISDGNLGIVNASAGVSLELIGNSILRLAGVAGATISGLTALNGMTGYATVVDATFTELGFWSREQGVWKKHAFKSDFSTGQTYSVSNFVTDRTIDFSSFTLAELGDFVGTLASDLQGTPILN